MVGVSNSESEWDRDRLLEWMYVWMYDQLLGIRRYIQFTCLGNLKNELHMRGRVVIFIFEFSRSRESPFYLYVRIHASERLRDFVL